ncbi:hypothetical protein AB3X52_14405 [Nocardioides sp. DS6]|uniref:DUF3592 domain-containing protein n=1 Tax=Nocardioides eburneus TaxID=3231482 RepID=A0ABV3T3I5_9ACTN
MTNFWLSPAVRWDANWFTRGLCLIGLPLVTVVFALAALAVHTQGSGDPSTGYFVAKTSDDACTGSLSSTPGGAPTVEVHLSRSSRSICGKITTGQRIYYDPVTLYESPGPSNYLVGTALLGLLAAGSAYLTVLVWVAWIRRLRRA